MVLHCCSKLLKISSASLPTKTWTGRIEVEEFNAREGSVLLSAIASSLCDFLSKIQTYALRLWAEQANDV